MTIVRPPRTDGRVRDQDPLDRLLRDAITMSQQLLLADSFLEIVGGTMRGERSPISWL